MAIKVADNTERIKQLVKESIDLIASNAEQGIPTTDLYLPKHLAGDVREAISDTFDKDGTRYDWRIVRRGYNQYTGRPESYTSETIGDKKHYRLQIF